MYKFKKPPKKEYGEFQCPYCKQPFFNKTSLAGHVGGAHRRFAATKTKKPHCKFCDRELIENKNWPKWAVKQQNLICQTCKRKQNRDSYHKKKRIKIEKREKFEKHLALIKSNKKIRELNRLKEIANGR